HAALSADSYITTPLAVCQPLFSKSFLNRGCDCFTVLCAQPYAPKAFRASLPRFCRGRSLERSLILADFLPLVNTFLQKIFQGPMKRQNPPVKRRLHTARNCVNLI